MPYLTQVRHFHSHSLQKWSSLSGEHVSIFNRVCVHNRACIKIHGPKTNSPWTPPNISRVSPGLMHTGLQLKSWQRPVPGEREGGSMEEEAQEGRKVKDGSITVTPLPWPGSATCPWQKYRQSTCWPRKVDERTDKQRGCKETSRGKEEANVSEQGKKPINLPQGLRI